MWQQQNDAEENYTTRPAQKVHAVYEEEVQVPLVALGLGLSFRLSVATSRLPVVRSVLWGLDLLSVVQRRSFPDLGDGFQVSAYGGQLVWRRREAGPLARVGQPREQPPLVPVPSVHSGLKLRPVPLDQLSLATEDTYIVGPRGQKAYKPPGRARRISPN